MWPKIIAFGIVACFVVPTDLMLAQKMQKADAATTSEILGNASYVKVYRKNHPQGRSTNVYNVSTRTLEGKVFLFGQNSRENPSQYYLYAMDSIELITFPNSDYEEPPEEDPKKFAEMSVRQQTQSLYSQVRSLDKKIDQKNNEIRQNNKSLRLLGSRLDHEEDSATKKMIQTEIDLLNDENDFLIGRVNSLRSEYTSVRIDYLRKRREALNAGELD